MSELMTSDPRNRWLIRSWPSPTARGMGFVSPIKWEAYPPDNNPAKFEYRTLHSFDEARKYVSNCIEAFKRLVH